MHGTRIVSPAMLLSFAIIMCGRQTLSSDQGLTNQHLKVAAVPWGPFLVWKCPGDLEWSGRYFGECPNEGQRLYSGVLWDILSFMQQARNCKFTLDIKQQKKYGNCYASDNCTGMIGQANRGEVDLALGLILDNGIIEVTKPNLLARNK